MNYNNVNINSNAISNGKNKTGSHSFRLNSEFSFKDRFDSHNNSVDKKASKKYNQTQTAGAFILKVKVKKNNKSIDKIVNKYSSLKSSNEKLSSVAHSERHHNFVKEEELNRLNDYLEEYVTTNDELKYQIENETKIRSEYEYEQRSIADYCNDLKKKFNNVFS